MHLEVLQIGILQYFFLGANSWQVSTTLAIIGDVSEHLQMIQQAARGTTPLVQPIFLRLED